MKSRLSKTITDIQSSRIIRAAACGVVFIACAASTLALTSHQETKPAAPSANGSSSSAAAATFTVDDTHSMSLFRVTHMGAGRFWGRFNEISGTAQYAPDSMLALDITIAVSSVDCANKKLDGHLKSPDFFNAVEYPTMKFVSTGAKSLGAGRFDVTGNLTIHGVTKPITVVIECSPVVVMGGAARAGFETTFEIKRSDFGMSYGVEHGAVSDETRVIVSLECVDKSKAPANP